eukprot:gb/GFBE01076008.1/.p1 GENE.gb/GFBE01076008.1/~~gb/GFBE01076008.1/.p1  ORF type:complete len:391 (+),score=92.96 gb/GFBE01076008.1/:3-1175(+)
MKPASDGSKALLLKYGSLVAFCLQNTMAPIVFRYAMTETTEAERASTAAVLFVTEMGKCVLSFLLLTAEEGFSMPRVLRTLHEDAFQNRSNSLKLGVPAVIYAIQNALLQVSSGNLPAAVWHVSYQGKILAVALMSMLLLGKTLKRLQWLSLFIMGAGIATVELSNAEEKNLDSMANAAEQNFMLGLSMVAAACFCSAFAGVFTEKMFKQIGSENQKKISLWLQNCVLSVWSMLIALAAFTLQQIQLSSAQDGSGDFSLLRGFTMKIWALVALNSVGGMLVAMAIKYADNILRGFSSAFATVNGALLSVHTFGFVIRPSFVLGMAMVLASALMYGGVLKLPCESLNQDVRLCASRIGEDAASCKPKATLSSVGNPQDDDLREAKQMKEEV